MNELAAKIQRIMREVPDPAFATELIIDAAARAFGMQASERGRKAAHARWDARKCDADAPHEHASDNNLPLKNPPLNGSGSDPDSVLKTEPLAQGELPKILLPRAKTSKPPKPQNPRLGIFMGWVRTRWEKKYGVNWQPEPGVVRLTKAFVLGLSEADFVATESHLDGFFSDGEKFLVTHCHPLRSFLSNTNKYRARASPILPKREFVRAPEGWGKSKSTSELLKGEGT